MKVKLILFCFVFSILMTNSYAAMCDRDAEDVFKMLKEEIKKACYECSSLRNPAIDSSCRAQVQLYVTDLLLKYPQIRACNERSSSNRLECR
ncbi:MAG: hypothetical protein ACI4V7_01715 [Succinivibrionaceae bacterium]